jgi:putative sterol carrier protein
VAESAQEFFDTLPSRVDESKTAGLNATYLFDVEGAGKWTVAVKEGNVDVREGGDSADTTISANEENFLKIVNGEENATAAYMTGKIKVTGDMGTAMKLQKLF